MKKILPILIVLVLFGAGVYVMQTRTTDHSAHQHAKDIYYCPMHPQIQSDKPGTCPICYMKLVKKDAGMDVRARRALPLQTDASAHKVADHAAVMIDAHKQQLIGIRTAQVEKKPLVKTIHTYGYVAHDFELYDAQLEYIEAWRTFYPFLYRRAIKDEFRTDWREYYRRPPAQSRWRSDEKVKAQQRLVKAEAELIHMGLTEAELEKLREIKYGQPWTRPDLLYYGDDYSVWIYAQVFESDLGFVSPTQKVSVTIPAYGETTEGVVRSVSPVIDPTTRTARVRIELPKYRSELSVNMYVTVEIPVELNESLVVPREAVMDTGLNKIVYVQTHEGTFEPRRVETDFEGEGVIAVTSGLKEGEMVVVDGNFLLDSESRLQGALTGGHQHD